MRHVEQLIARAREKGLSLAVADGKLRVTAPKNRDADLDALIEELRRHREEVRRFLAARNPPSEAEPSPPLVGETIRAVKIASAILSDDLWLILDPSFTPLDDCACYFAEEIALLRNKTPQELREIHKTKLAFPRCRVIQ